jgi:hypothetical protein
MRCGGRAYGDVLFPLLCLGQVVAALTLARTS